MLFELFREFFYRCLQNLNQIKIDVFKLRNGKKLKL
jgi:hypothetical protein